MEASFRITSTAEVRLLWRLLDAKITMAEGRGGSPRSPKEARTGWTGTNVRDHEKVGTHAFTRDLLPIWARRRLSWAASRLP